MGAMDMRLLAAFAVGCTDARGTGWAAGAAGAAAAGAAAAAAGAGGGGAETAAAALMARTALSMPVPKMLASSLLLKLRPYAYRESCHWWNVSVARRYSRLG